MTSSPELPITGTFLDEISHDIPSANWGSQAWAKEFASMQADGIDTVILIRAGYRDRATFPSQVLSQLHPHLIVQEDLVDLFLRLADQHHMAFYFGTYDSGLYWQQDNYQLELDINRAFVDEVWQRYGDYSAFQGWYICHEINTFSEGMMQVYEQLSRHLKDLKNLPILISPYIRGSKQFADAISLTHHEQEWREVFARLDGLVDIVAFQDGQVEFAELPDYLAINAQLARQHHITCWSNIETFDRDVYIKFPPIAWPKLRYKIEAARSAGVDKLITFEYSHFLSPNSMFPSAHHLRDCYREWYRSA
ncbi:MAG: DUF4434 domain-containing protein [Cyanobacteriota bacterium]|nr:DUF4434 domain-containing protein [Cyanobacteriota bacterium]